MKKFSGLFALMLALFVARPAFAAPAWHVVPSPTQAGSNASLDGIATVSPTNLWAVGITQVIGAQTVSTLVEHWNGTSWSVVPSPSMSSMYSSLRAVTRVPGTNHLWAVGYYVYGTGNAAVNQTLYEYYDGSRWSIVPSPAYLSNTRFISSLVALAPNNIWAVGTSHPVGTNPSHILPLIEHWNGSTWTVVAGPKLIGGLNGITALSASNIWAVGFVNLSSTISVPLIEHFNGTSWSASTFTSMPYGFNAVSADAANDVWAVGLDTAWHYNGTSWTASTLPTGNDLRSVAVIAGQVWTVGVAYGHLTPVAFTYNGTWVQSTLPSTGTSSSLYALVAPTASTLVAVGVMQSSTLVEQYN